MVRVNALELEGLKGFVNGLLRGPDFFARWGRPLKPHLAQDLCDRYAVDLLKDLKKLGSVGGPDESWRTWPSLTLEIPTAVLLPMRDALPEPRARLPEDMVRTLLDAAIVTDCRGPQIADLFGRATRQERLAFGSLVSAQAAGPDGDGWLQCCLKQIVIGAGGGLVKMGWAPLRHPQSGAQFLPALCEVRDSPRRGLMAFDIVFVDVLGPESMPASQRMLPVGEIYWLDIDNPAIRSLPLAQLRREMRDNRRLRLPILDGKGRPRHIVHKSLMDEFLTDALEKREAQGATELLPSPSAICSTTRPAAALRARASSRSARTTPSRMWSA